MKVNLRVSMKVKLKQKVEDVLELNLKYILENNPD
jgi:hypothetical protein